MVSGLAPEKISAGLQVPKLHTGLKTKASINTVIDIEMIENIEKL